MISYIVSAKERVLPYLSYLWMPSFEFPALMAAFSFSYRLWSWLFSFLWICHKLAVTFLLVPQIKIIFYLYFIHHYYSPSDQISLFAFSVTPICNVEATLQKLLWIIECSEGVWSSLSRRLAYDFELIQTIYLT